MVEMDAKYPGYGFASHKGYTSAIHTAAMSTMGITPIHRKSFSNVAALLEH
jgi:ribonuclease HII